MKQDIVTVVLAVLMMGFFLPGCAQSQVNDLKAQIAELESENEALEEENPKLQEQVDRLKTEKERLGEENLELQKEVDRLEEEVDRLEERTAAKEERTTAKIEISFEPDPVPFREGWRWTVTLKEVKGFGVKLTGITVEIYGGDELLTSWRDNSWLEAMDNYLPAYGEAESERHIAYQEARTHVGFVVTGVDDNGHSIVAENRVELLPWVR